MPKPAMCMLSDNMRNRLSTPLYVEPVKSNRKMQHFGHI